MMISVTYNFEVSHDDSKILNAIQMLGRPYMEEVITTVTSADEGHDDRSMVQTRVAHFVSEGLIYEAGGRYSLTGTGQQVLTSYKNIYRTGAHQA